MQALIKGNSSAPQIGSIDVSVIFTELTEQGFGIQFSNSFTVELTQLVGFNYVDDCNLLQSGNNINTTHQDMQISTVGMRSTHQSHRRIPSS